MKFHPTTFILKYFLFYFYSCRRKFLIYSHKYRKIKIKTNKIQKFKNNNRHISLPAASPGILTGLRNSLSLAWMFMIAAELIAATQGIGYLLSDGRETARPDIVVIAIILLAILGKITDSLMKLAESWLLRWRDIVKK